MFGLVLPIAIKASLIGVKVTAIIGKTAIKCKYLKVRLGANALQLIIYTD